MYRSTNKKKNIFFPNSFFSNIFFKKRQILLFFFPYRKQRKALYNEQATTEHELQVNISDAHIHFISEAEIKIL